MRFADEFYELSVLVPADSETTALSKFDFAGLDPTVAINPSVGYCKQVLGRSLLIGHFPDRESYTQPRKSAVLYLQGALD